MKKITALLLCFLLLCTCSAAFVTAATEDTTTDIVISTTVPETHKITVTADNAKVFYGGFESNELQVGRLSRPRLLVRAESGKIIKSVLLDGVDVTAELQGGYLELMPVYEDKTLVVSTVDETAVQNGTYTVKGTVTLNGKPLENADMELRSTLKTAKTDKNGCFVFTDTEAGEHSLTALKDGKVIGYLSFSLQADIKTDVTLLKDGTYTVYVDQNGAGVDLVLELNEKMGTLSVTDVNTVEKEETDTNGSCCSWWWLLLLLLIICIVVLEIYRRKKKKAKQ